MKIGLEVEYWITDDQGKLTSSKKLAERLDFAEQEFVEPMLELQTDPYEDLHKLKQELFGKIKELLDSAEELDQRIIPLGTPLNSGEISIIPSRRGKIQKEIVGQNLEGAKRVAGTHIHFEQTNVKNQLNMLTALDPALALTNTSPYYQGEKLASSSRNHIYRFYCYENFPKHGQLWKYTDSKTEWEERMEKRFKEFLKEAKQKGISEEIMREFFTAEDALWTPVRLRKAFPTVEWRAPDSAKLSQTLKMVAEVKSIMENVSNAELKIRADNKASVQKNNVVELPSFNNLKRLSNKAIKTGIEDEEVNSYLKDLGFSVDQYTNLSKKLEASNFLKQSDARKIRLKAHREFKKDFKAVSKP